MEAASTHSDLPKILVLLATHNGSSFIEEQLDTVLKQRDVDVTVLVSDDASTDATQSILAELAAGNPRIRLLPPGEFGSAGANFSRLIRDADTAGFDAVAFCDQDDLWAAGKLARHYFLLTLEQGVDGGGAYAAVSSNVTAFKEDGTRTLVVKNQRQQLADYIFESGGPGSTFLIRPAAFAMVQAEFRTHAEAAAAVDAHDWLIYALVRASGRRWFIDGASTVEYRQHDANVLGANEGFAQNFNRLRQIANGSHRRQVRAILHAVLPVADEIQRPRIQWLLERTESLTPISRLRIARRAHHFRRRRRDQCALAATVTTGVW